MWTVTQSDDVLGSLTRMQEVLKSDDKTMDTESEDVEMNTGVDCPGERSLEPFVGSVMTLENKLFLNEAILVEIAETDTFSYKFKK
jgi:hypothetical protein